MSASSPSTRRFDDVVAAGFAGLYMLHELRGQGLLEHVTGRYAPGTAQARGSRP